MNKLPTLVMCLLTAGAHAQVAWEELSPEQQTTLAPLKDKWSDIDPAGQERLHQ